MDDPFTSENLGQSATEVASSREAVNAVIETFSEPAVQALAERAIHNPELMATMKVVQTGKATAQQMKYFQEHVAKLAEVVKRIQDQDPPFLLSLPLELRFEIYRYLFPVGMVFAAFTAKQTQQTRAFFRIPRHNQLVLNLGLLRVSKQISREAKQVFYERKSCVWQITDLEDLNFFNQNIAYFHYAEVIFSMDVACTLLQELIEHITHAIRCVRSAGISSATTQIKITIRWRLGDRISQSMVDHDLDFLDPSQKFKDVVETQRGSQWMRYDARRHGYKYPSEITMVTLEGWKAQLHAVFVRTQLRHALRKLKGLIAHIPSVDVAFAPFDLEAMQLTGGIRGTWVADDRVSFWDGQHRRAGSIEILRYMTRQGQFVVRNTSELQIKLTSFSKDGSRSWSTQA